MNGCFLKLVQVLDHDAFFFAELQDGVGTYRCTCEPGWTGVNCDEDINYCVPDPCQNGDCEVKDSINCPVCISVAQNLLGFMPLLCFMQDGVSTYRCTCEPGWTGVNCDEDINYCVPDPCQNGECEVRDSIAQCV